MSKKQSEAEKHLTTKRTLAEDSLLDVIKSVFLTVILGWIINIVLAYILDILVMSAALPQFGGLFPALQEHLRAISTDTNASERFADLIFCACMLLSCIPSFTITYRFNKRRKEKFLSETKGFIPRKEGLIFHLKKHWLSEAAISICQLILFLSTGLFSPTGFFRILIGKAAAFPISILLILIVQILGILSSQSHWRAVHFIGEE